MESRRKPGARPTENAFHVPERELSLRNRIANVFLTVPDEEMYAEVLAILLEATGSEYGVFGYLDEDGALVVPSMTRHIWDKCEVSGKTIVFPRDQWGNSLWPRAIREEQLLYSNEPSVLVPQGHVPITRNIATPIIYRDQAIGLFQVANKDSDYDDTDLATCRTVADYVAPILSARLERDCQGAARGRSETEATAARDWQATFDGVTDGILLLAPEGTILRCNRAMAEILGRAPEEIIGRLCHEVIHGTEGAFPGCPRAAAMASLERESTELQVNGRWVRVVVDPLLDDAGRLRSLVHTWSDITEQHRAAEALAESETKFRALYESTTEALTILDEQGFLDCNDAALRAYGCATRDEVVGKHPSELSPATQSDGRDSRTAADEWIAAAMQQGSAHFEWLHQRADGTPFLADVLLSRFELGGRSALHGIVRDITKQRHAEEALAESEAKFRALYESTADAAMVSDEHGFLDCNEAALRIFGCATREELLGKHPSELSPSTQPDGSDSRTASAEWVATAMREGSACFEWLHRRTDGTPFAAEVMLSRVNLSAGPLLQGSVRDITDRKRAQEALAASETRLRLLFEASPDGIVLVDPETMTPVEFNDQAARQLGYSREDFAHLRVSDFLVGEARGETAAQVAGVVAGQRQDHEAQVRTKTGELRDQAITLQHLQLGDRRLLHVIARDITLQKRAERDQARMVAGLRAIVEAADELVLIDSVGTLHRRAVELAREKLGLERCSIFLVEGDGLRGTYGTDIEGKTSDEHEVAIANNPAHQWVVSLVEPGTRRWFVEERERTTHDGERMVHVGPGWIAWTPIQTATRALGVFYNDSAITGAPLDQTQQDVTAVYCSMLATLTEQKRAEEELRSSEERLRAIFETSPDGIVLVEPGTLRILQFNDTACRQLGYTREEYAQLRIPDVEAVETPEQTVERLDDIIAGARQEFETRQRTKMGEVRDMLVTARQLTLGGKAVGHVVVRDITEQKRAELALRERERLLRETGLTARVGGWEHDLVTRKAVWTDTLHEILEFDGPPPGPEEHLSYYVEESRGLLAAALERAVTLGESFDLELLGHTGRGRPVWGRVVGKPVFSGDTCVKLWGIFQDITDQKRAEEALVRSQAELQTSEGIYRNAISVALGVPYRRNYVDETYAFVGEAAEQVLGVRPDEFTVERFRAMIQETVLLGDSPTDDVEEADRAFVRGEVAYYRAYYRIVTPRGEERWLSDSSIPVLSPETGEVVASIGILQDITEQKRAEEALRESEARYRGVVDNIGIGIAVIGPNMEVLSTNRQMQVWFPGVPDGSGLCYRVFNAPPRDEPCSYCPTIETLRDGQVHEAVTDTPSGNQIRHYRVVATPLRDASGEVVAAIEMVEDITERLHLEEQIRQTSKLEAVGTLAGGVAHDFNNILTGIIGYATLMATEGLVGPEGAEELKVIRDLADRAAGLTRQLLAFSRRQTLEPSVLNPNELIEHLSQMLERIIGEDVKQVLRLAPDLGHVRVDPGQIEQVLMNLAVNARDAMPQGGTLAVETANVVLDREYAAVHVGVTPGDYVMIAVSDTGCGMDEATRERVFEPFFTTKAVGEGTGLGLATAYGIVKQHGGNIWVYSEPGQGTTFRTYLPRVRDGEDTLAQPTPTQPDVGGTETILLVEDDPGVLEIAQRTLERRGYRILPVADPTQAEAVLEQHRDKIALVLTDVVMPAMLGPELFARLQASQPSLRVLYMSGYTRDAAAANGTLEDGAQFLHKPFTPTVLAAKVREVLDG